MTSVISDCKILATISKEHGAGFSLYTPNKKQTVSVVYTVLPSAKVTTKVLSFLTCYPIALATALVTKLWVAPESTIQLIMWPLHRASNYSKQGQLSRYKFDSFDWTNFCNIDYNRGLHPRHRAALGLSLLRYGFYYTNVIATSSPAKIRDLDTPSLQTPSKGTSTYKPAN